MAEIMVLYILTTSVLASALLAGILELSAAFRRLKLDTLFLNKQVSKNITIITEKRHFQELSEAPELSMRAAFSDIFGFKYTLNNYDGQSLTTIPYRAISRILNIIAPAHFSYLHSRLEQEMSTSFVNELEKGKAIKKEGGDDWISVPLGPTVRRTTSSLLSLVFYGEKLSADPSFTRALLQWPRDTIFVGGAFQFVPVWMQPFVHAVMTNRGKAMHKLVDRLTPLVAEQQVRGESNGSKDFQHSILGWMLDITRGKDFWEPVRVVESVIGMWFAASHQPWMNLVFMLHELCEHPDYVDDLRQEIGESSHLTSDELLKLPLLDSFMKETLRLNPLDQYSIRRKALKPYTFSQGGPHIPAGKVACVSAFGIMKNEKNYRQPEKFMADRFIPGSSPDKTVAEVSKFTDANETFPMWGYGSLACPGRFLASLVMKTILAHLITNYDFRLEVPGSPKAWHWDTFRIPYESTRILFRKRQF